MNVKEKLVNATSSESLFNIIKDLHPGEKTAASFATAEFIRDNSLYTGNKRRELQIWATVYEFKINGQLFLLEWPDRNQGIFIIGGSDL